MKKTNDDSKKGTELLKEKLVNFKDSSIQNVQNKWGTLTDQVEAISDKARQDAHLRKLRKYNPLFMDVYTNTNFNLPKMIVIVDDSVRRGIDVCIGSIGWTDRKGNIDVLYLYHNAVPLSKLHFVPAPSCDSVYYADSFAKNRYIRLDCIFDQAHSDRLAELEYVAHCLGAKSCTIEINETSTETIVKKKKANHDERLNAKLDEGDVQDINNIDFQQNSSHSSSFNRAGKTITRFEGNDTPIKPKLKWFANDETIKRLIDMRCKGHNMVNSKTLKLSGSSSATMSKATACSIDNALVLMKVADKKDKGKLSMETQVVRENSTTLYFSIEF